MFVMKKTRTSHPAPKSSKGPGFGEVSISTGELKGKKLQLNPEITRPTKAIVKEAVFSIIREEIKGGVFLDLYAGSGQMGFQALSLGAKRAIFFESCPLAAKRIESFGLAHGLDFAVYYQEAFEGLKTLASAKQEIDLAFIDPPYEFWSAESALELLTLLQSAGVRLVILEMSSRCLWLQSLLGGKKKLPKEGVMVGRWRFEKAYRYGETTLLKCCSI